MSALGRKSTFSDADQCCCGRGRNHKITAEKLLKLSTPEVSRDLDGPHHHPEPPPSSFDKLRMRATWRRTAGHGMKISGQIPCASVASSSSATMLVILIIGLT